MTTNHWTDKSSRHFRLNIAHNFVTRIEEKLKQRNYNQSEFAKVLGVPRAHVSRVFSDPGNLTLNTIIQWCRALGMKPALIVYEDSAIPDHTAPIHPDVFIKCWEMKGYPVDMWPFQEKENDNPK